MENEKALKRLKILENHKIISWFYYSFRVLSYKVSRIGKSSNCRMCQTCRKKGCFKNRIAKKFKMAGVFGVKCYEKSE